MYSAGRSFSPVAFLDPVAGRELAEMLRVEVRNVGGRRVQPVDEVLLGSPVCVCSPPGTGWTCLSGWVVWGETLEFLDAQIFDVPWGHAYLLFIDYDEATPIVASLVCVSLSLLLSPGLGCMHLPAVG
jgi:hypothetical protein